jgi:hypothetical protein
LLVPVLNDQPTAFGQLLRCTADDMPKGIEPIRAGDQRIARLEDERIEVRIACCNVWWIRDDHIEATHDRGVPIAVHKAHIETKSRGVLARHCERRQRHVARDDARARALARNRERDCARTRAEIEHAAGFGEMREHQLDQQLRLGSRNQHVACHGEIERPELAPARQICDRLRARLPFEQRSDVSLVHNAFRMRVEATPIATEHVREQHLAVAPLVGRARRTQIVHDPCHDASASAAS